MSEPIYRTATGLRELRITNELVGDRPAATLFRYYAAGSLVCELRLPCDVNGMISPDGCLMLIGYLQRLVGGYGEQNGNK